VDPVDAATRLVTGRFPEAVAAVLGGSVLSAARTATPDLDVVVIRPDGHRAYRETLRHDGWPVELFVHTPATYAGFVRREVAARRSPLLHMVGGGVVLVDGDGTAARMRSDRPRRGRLYRHAGVHRHRPARADRRGCVAG
jgi:hypothetical protein